MNLKTNISLLVALGLTSAAIAGDEISTRVTIAMVDDESAEELRLELDSDQLGFDLHDMQEGESRSIVDQSGRRQVHQDATTRGGPPRCDMDG
jgi:hypothetical protein